MPQILNTLIFKLKPLLCVVFGIYAFISSYPGSFAASHSNAQQQVDCKTSDDSNKVVTWTGACVNGFLDGDGELVFETVYAGKKVLTKRVSKFYQGNTTGVYFTKSLGPLDGKYWNTLDVTDGGKPFYTTSTKPDANIVSLQWRDFNDDPQIPMNFDEAFVRVVALAKKSNQNSIDPNLLKEYISGKYKFSKADTQTQTVSPDLADNANAADDPQVFGGSSSPKAIKKKKK